MKLAATLVLTAAVAGCATLSVRPSAMTLDEKIGQLFVYVAPGPFMNEGSPRYRELLRQVRENHVGGIHWATWSNVFESAFLNRRLQRLARVPLLVSADLEAGVGMRFADTTYWPWPMAVAATGDPDLARREGEIVAEEARAIGLNQIYAPVADVNVNPDNPVINVRSFGEDPEEVARFVAAFVRGVESRGIIATAKHFPGHGDTRTDSHRSLPVLSVSRERLERVELVPFRAAIAAGAGAVMTAHLSLPALDDEPAPIRPGGVAENPYTHDAAEAARNATIPASLSSKITDGLLRGELGFRGLVVTDALDMGGIVDHFDPGEAAVRAILAGADEVLKSADTDAAIAGVRRAVETGRITRDRLDLSVGRILAAKARMGRPGPDWNRIFRVVDSPEHRAVAEEIARRSVTLVRESPGVLPLDRKVRVFQLVVADAERGLGGDLNRELKSRLDSPAEMAALDARSSEADVAAFLESASRADVVLLALFARFQSGKGSIALPGLAKEAIERLSASGPRVVAISFGSPYVLREVPNLTTYLCAWGSQTDMQVAVARALFGEAPITGRLPVTIADLAPRGAGIQKGTGRRGNGERGREATAVNFLPLFLALALGAKTPHGSLAAERLARVDGVVSESIARHELPGAVVLAGRRGKVVFRKAYGDRAVEPFAEPMTVDTVFDVASLTKTVATATSVMILVEEGRLLLSDPVARHIPEFAPTGGDRARVTIEHLLAHRAGFPPDDPLDLYTGTPEEIFARKYQQPLKSAPGSQFVYSDVGYEVLGEIVRRVSGERLDRFAEDHIFRPLGMKDTTFLPLSGPIPARRIAPTERRGDHWMRGEVHDPRAYVLGGVAGHAGLFSTAADLARFCQMILDGGNVGRARILSPSGVEAMTRPRFYGDGDVRGLGWDIATAYSKNRGDLFPVGSFGHTGFTGTSLWIDPASESFVVFLSNRVHPGGKGDVLRLRALVSTIVAAAVMDDSRPRARALAARVPRPSREVAAGIDVLAAEGFRAIAGKRIGLVTNATGRARDGRSTIGVLTSPEAKKAGVTLVRLFSPEHGLRTDADARVPDQTDPGTGLPVVSLYGERRRPTSAELADLDALVLDIQDVGARFYTYITTGGYLVEEAAKAKIPLVVLDRPDPIGATVVEGPLADADKLSFTAYHAVPVRYGMTPAEMALLVNGEKKLGADVRVVKMRGWSRDLWYDETGLEWVNPSPNMRSLEAAALYPGIGLLETTNLSVGRGTDAPFEVVGAPWLEGRRLAEVLNARAIPGVRFSPVHFTPSASVFAGERCGGVRLNVVDREALRSVSLGIEIAAALRDLYPVDWDRKGFVDLLANGAAFRRLEGGETAPAIIASWQKDLDEFVKRRAKYLLY